MQTSENLAAYKQRNLYVKILHQNKKFYSTQLDPKVISDNKNFWKTLKPLFSNKIQSTSCIALLENDVVESDEGTVAEIMNKYFVNMIETLGISCANNEGSLNNFDENSCSRVIRRFQSH